MNVGIEIWTKMNNDFICLTNLNWNKTLKFYQERGQKRMNGFSPEQICCWATATCSVHWNPLAVQTHAADILRTCNEHMHMHGYTYMAKAYVLDSQLDISTCRYCTVEYHSGTVHNILKCTNPRTARELWGAIWVVWWRSCCLVISLVVPGCPMQFNSVFYPFVQLWIGNNLDHYS